VIGVSIITIRLSIVLGFRAVACYSIYCRNSKTPELRMRAIFRGSLSMITVRVSIKANN